MKRKCEKHPDARINDYNRCTACATEAVVRCRINAKKKAVQYKGGKCELCGYDKCLAALDFHHKNPEEKEFGIATKGMTRSWEKLKKELDKCIMLCSNCHRELHSREENMNIDS